MNRIISTFIFLVSSFLLSQSPLDKTYWESMNQTEKFSFIQGFLTAIHESTVILKNEVNERLSHDPYWRPPLELDRTARKLKDYLHTDPDYDYTQLTNLIDIFYTNPDNNNIDLLTAIKILVLHENGKKQHANEMLLMKQKEYLKDN